MGHFKGATVTWLGHATVHFATAKGTSVIVDPWITGNPKYPADFPELGTIDLILLTHGHSDHTGDALSLSKKYKSKVICMVELAMWLNSQGMDEKQLSPMNLGGTQRFADMTISMVEAKHSSSVMDGGKAVYTGSATGLVVNIDGGPCIYFAGDTSVYSDMKLIKQLYAPEIGFLPIGDHYTMGPKQAAMAAEFSGVKTVVPIHYGTFPQLTGTPAELEKELMGKGIEVLALTPGVSAK